MPATNNITGDRLVSTTSDAYRDNYDSIFGKANLKDKPKTTDLDKYKDLFKQSNVPFSCEFRGFDNKYVCLTIRVGDNYKDDAEELPVKYINTGTVRGYNTGYSFVVYFFDRSGKFLYMSIGM